jgi:hypothetical protein
MSGPFFLLLKILSELNVNQSNSYFLQLKQRQKISFFNALFAVYDVLQLRMKKEKILREFQHFSTGLFVYP